MREDEFIVAQRNPSLMKKVALLSLYRYGRHLRVRQLPRILTQTASHGCGRHAAVGKTVTYSFGKQTIPTPTVFLQPTCANAQAVLGFDPKAPYVGTGMEYQRFCPRSLVAVIAQYDGKVTYADAEQGGARREDIH